MADKELELALCAAREMQPTAAATRRAVLQVMRQAPSVRAGRPMTGHMLAAVLGACTAAAAFLVFVAKETPPVEPQATAGVARLGPSVAIVHLGARVALADQDARYSIERVQPGLTRIRVTDGTVGLRLFAGDEPHRLQVLTPAVIAEAHGTVFSVRYADGKTQVQVYEGQVSVSSAGQPVLLSAGQGWRDGRVFRVSTRGPWVDQLLALDAPHVESEPESAPTVRRDQPKPKAALGPDSLVQRWRYMRELRGRGDYTQAIDVLQELVLARDGTWSPLALVELARLHESLGQPQEAKASAEQYLDAYPHHQLTGEMQQLRCRAARQLNIPVPECL